jgi:hypothetical protein
MMTHRNIGAAAVTLFAALSGACSGDSTGTAVVDASGLYQLTGQLNPAACEPASAIDVLEPVLITGDPLAAQAVIRIEQQGEQLSWKAIESDGQTIEPGAPLVEGTIDAEGHFRIEFTEQATPFVLGERTFFEQPSSLIEGQFDMAASPITFTASAVSTEVFREGSATAPVFATCTSTGTATAVRTGD